MRAQMFRLLIMAVLVAAWFYAMQKRNEEIVCIARGEEQC